MDAWLEFRASSFRHGPRYVVGETQGQGAGRSGAYYNRYPGEQGQGGPGGKGTNNQPVLSSYISHAPAYWKVTDPDTSL